MIVTQPGPLVLSLDELKSFLRIANSDEDALLAGLERAAIDMCEAFTRRILIVRPVEEMLVVSRGWTRLCNSPVRSIDAVGILDAQGTETPLAAASYAVDIDAAGEGWMKLSQPIAEGRVRVSYQAGLANDHGGVPEALRHGVLRLAAHFYADRDAKEGQAPPAAVTALWRPWRRLGVN